MAHRLADALAIADSERDDFLRFAREELPRGSGHVVLPPLPQRTGVSPLRHNLPLVPTGLLGREGEVHRACELLRTGTRLLTLIGTGGIGKTRLGLEVATALVDTFPDGVWWADLAPLADRDLLLGVVSAALGVHDNSSGTLLPSLVRALGDRQLLLVLDNCEHLIDECAQLVEATLSSAPGLRIMATSRVPFRLAGEVRHPVGPLTG